MNYDIKQLWIEALESGQYQQGHGQLYNPDTQCYCALGVLCQIYQEETKIGHFSKNGCYYYLSGLHPDRHPDYLPDAIREWAGLSYARLQHVVNWNDKQERSFSHIAVHIAETF